MIGVLVSGEGTNLQALIDAGLPIVGRRLEPPGVRALARAAPPASRRRVRRGGLRGPRRA